MSVRVLLVAALLVGCVGEETKRKCLDCKAGGFCKATDELVNKTCFTSDKACQIDYSEVDETMTRGCKGKCRADEKSCDKAPAKTDCCCDSDLCNCGKEDIKNNLCKLPPTTTPGPTTTPPPLLKCWNWDAFAGKDAKPEEVDCKPGEKWCWNNFFPNYTKRFTGCPGKAYCKNDSCTDDKCTTTALKYHDCFCQGDLCNKNKCLCGPPGGGSRPDTKTTATAVAHLFALAAFYFN